MRLVRAGENSLRTGCGVKEGGAHLGFGKGTWESNSLTSLGQGRTSRCGPAPIADPLVGFHIVPLLL